MTAFIYSQGIEWEVEYDIDEGSPEYGWSPSIDITHIYALDNPNLIEINIEETLDDVERQLWILKDKKRNL